MGDFCAFLKEEDGVTVVEIILVLLVLIALVLIFKEQLTKVVKSILSKVSSQADAGSQEVILSPADRPMIMSPFKV